MLFNANILNFSINLISILILGLLIFKRKHTNHQQVFTLIVFNFIIFFISIFFSQVEISMGATFGMFAVFSMLRYRTEGISLVDMTYLFLAISLGLLNSVAYGDISLKIAINGIILGMVQLLDNEKLFPSLKTQLIILDNIDLIKDEKALLEDLKNRTNLNIQRFSIIEIDYLKDSCKINIYYFE